MLQYTCSNLALLFAQPPSWSTLFDHVVFHTFPASKKKSSHVALYAKALIANCKTVRQVFAYVMSVCA